MAIGKWDSVVSPVLAVDGYVGLTSRWISWRWSLRLHVWPADWSLVIGYDKVDEQLCFELICVSLDMYYWYLSDSICLCVCLSVYLPIYLFVYLSVSTIYVYTYTYIYIYVCTVYIHMLYICIYIMVAEDPEGLHRECYEDGRLINDSKLDFFGWVTIFAAQDTMFACLLNKRLLKPNVCWW